MEARHLYRNEGVSSRELCARFNLSKSAMLYVLNGKSWKHLPLLLLVLLMAVPAFGQQKHPFIPDPSRKPLVIHNQIVYGFESISIGPCIDTRTRAEKIAAGCIVEMGNGIEYHCSVGHGCLVALTTEPVRIPDKFDRSFWLATSAWLGGSTADLVTTKFALDRGGVERNPLHAEDGGHKLRWTSAIGATAGTWAFAAYCERKGHRRIARGVLIAGAIVRTGLAFWNNSRRR